MRLTQDVALRLFDDLECSKRETRELKAHLIELTQDESILDLKRKLNKIKLQNQILTETLLKILQSISSQEVNS